MSPSKDGTDFVQPPRPPKKKEPEVNAEIKIEIPRHTEAVAKEDESRNIRVYGNRW